MNPHGQVDATPEIEAEIRRHGLAAGMSEACGIVFSDGTVVRLPNRAQDSISSYAMSAQDIYNAVAQYVDSIPLKASFAELRPVDFAVALWHTHPSGLVGPSRGDLRMMRELQLGQFNQMVYALPDGPLVRF